LVDDETVAGDKIAGTEEFVRAPIGPYREALQFQCEFERTANGQVIIDDHDDGGPLRRLRMLFRCDWLHLDAPHSAPDFAAKCRVIGVAALMWLNSRQQFAC